MKRSSQIIGIAAAAGIAYKLLTYKKSNGKTPLDDVSETYKTWTDKLSYIMTDCKDRIRQVSRSASGKDIFEDKKQKKYYANKNVSRIP